MKIPTEREIYKAFMAMVIKKIEKMPYEYVIRNVNGETVKLSLGGKLEFDDGLTIVLK